MPMRFDGVADSRCRGGFETCPYTASCYDVGRSGNSETVSSCVTYFLRIARMSALIRSLTVEHMPLSVIELLERLLDLGHSSRQFFFKGGRLVLGHIPFPLELSFEFVDLRQKIALLLLKLGLRLDLLHKQPRFQCFSCCFVFNLGSDVFVGCFMKRLIKGLTGSIQMSIYCRLQSGNKMLDLFLWVSNASLASALPKANWTCRSSNDAWISFFFSSVIPFALPHF